MAVANQLDESEQNPRSDLLFARSAATSGGKDVEVQRVRIQNTARVRSEQVRGSEPGHPDEDPRDPLLYGSGSSL